MMFLSASLTPSAFNSVSRARRCLALSTCALGLLILPAVGADDLWIHDMDEAMSQATKQDKFILIDFTGSDWCGWCIKLDKEVFSREAFKRDAPEHFILVELDFPRNTEQSEEVSKHNRTWQETFNVRGFPTIILADAAGKAFARTGYRPDGPEAYNEHLATLVKAKEERDHLILQAKMVTGLEQAKVLDRLLSLEDVVVENREAAMARIIELDANDQAGLKSRYETQRLESRWHNAYSRLRQTEDSAESLKQIAEMRAEFGDWLTRQERPFTQLEMARAFALQELDRNDEANQAIETAMKNPAVTNFGKQMLAQAWVTMARKTEDLSQMIAACDRLIAIDPDSDLSQTYRSFRAGFEQQAAAKSK